MRHLQVTENCRHQIVYQMWLIQIKGASLIHVIENVLIICILLNTIQKTQPKKGKNNFFRWLQQESSTGMKALLSCAQRADSRNRSKCQTRDVMWNTSYTWPMQVSSTQSWLETHHKTLQRAWSLLSLGARMAAWGLGQCWTSSFQGISHQREAAP